VSADCCGLPVWSEAEARLVLAALLESGVTHGVVAYVAERPAGRGWSVMSDVWPPEAQRLAIHRATHKAAFLVGVAPSPRCGLDGPA
jgi:hypothetical protein